MSTKNYTKIRFSASDAALVLIDQQSGVMQLVHDYSPAELRNNVVGLAKLGKVFTLPTVVTSSSDQGPNGPIIPELLSMFWCAADSSNHWNHQRVGLSGVRGRDRQFRVQDHEGGAEGVLAASHTVSDDRLSPISLPRSGALGPQPCTR
jgi:nicotinamidase-related amidase